MMSGLSDTDTDAISTAVAILNEAGYRVEGVSHGKREHHGATFDLEVLAPTRTQRFEPQSEAVKRAAIDAPEFDMNGQPVEEADDGE